MTERLITPGARVRCLEKHFEVGMGPQWGWVGTVIDLDDENGLFIAYIAWDALHGNGRDRRKHKIPLHVWAFESERLAKEFLEVVPQLLELH